MASLRVRLTLALLITGLSGVIIVTVLVQRFTTTEFDNYVVEQDRTNFIADITAYYEVYGSWDDMRIARGRLPVPSFSDTEPQIPPPEPPTSFVRFMLIDQEGRVVIPGKGYAPGQLVSEADMQRAAPIVLDDETIGYVIADNGWPGRSGLEEAYLDRINQLLLVATGGALVLALVLSFLFARTLSKPLREIATAIQSIAHGNLEQQVPVRSRDEVGQVAAAFNQMSANLARANRLRRQMTADIAHELRTPLSVVVGYLASLSEGLLKPNAEHFKIMHDEAQHLQRLVEDLRILSLADAGELPLNLQPVAPAELINLAAAAFSHQAEQRHIILVVHNDPDVPLLHADPDRILQVLSNLLSNALRYTPEQGQITLASRADKNQIILSVQDTGPGIDPEHLPHIFERFYRADSSRHQEQNESGLGLAIARSIVEAHGGNITVQSTLGEGTTISMVFPVVAEIHTPVDDV
jgi:signal transduction histidine kinase